MRQHVLHSVKPRFKVAKYANVNYSLLITRLHVHAILIYSLVPGTSHLDLAFVNVSSLEYEPNYFM